MEAVTAEPSVRDRVAEVLAVVIAVWSDERGQGPHYLCDLDGSPTGDVRTSLATEIADALAAAGLLAGEAVSRPSCLGCGHNNSLHNIRGYCVADNCACKKGPHP